MVEPWLLWPTRARILHSWLVAGGLQSLAVCRGSDGCDEESEVRKLLHAGHLHLAVSFFSGLVTGTGGSLRDKGL